MTVPAILTGRRAALTALFVALCLVVGVGVMAIRFVVGGAQADTGDAIQQLALLRAKAAARPQAERALTMLRAEAGSQPTFLHGDSDATTQAALQTELKTLVEGNGGEVRSAYAVPVEHEHGLSLIAVQYDLTVPATKLRPLIYAIEGHMPYLFLSGIDLVPPQSWPAATDTAAAEPKIEVRWTVSGYRRSAAR